MLATEAERTESLRAFFEPAAIAVIGASPNPARGGHRILRNLSGHFTGDLYAVNPNAETVLDRKCYPTVLDVPGEVDLAVVFVPAAAVPSVVRDCVEKGVRAVCIESGGFADAGLAGEALQTELELAVAGTTTRLWGPNCAGYVSTNPPLSTSFVVTPGNLEPGNVSFVAQSGMMAAALLVQILTQDRFRVDKACSIGNKCDVDESDLLEFLAESDGSDVIAFYLESIHDGPRFAAACDRAGRHASLLALVGGLSQSGAEVALSHTGSIAAGEAAVAGLLRQHGVLQVDDFMELVDLADPLSRLAVRGCGDSIAVLTFSGAAGVVAADLFSTRGLRLATLSERTTARLRELYPSWLEPQNPVDVWSTVELRGLERTIADSLEALLEDDAVDAVLFMPLAFEFFAARELEAFARLARASTKPIVAWPFGEDGPLAMWRTVLREADVGVCRSLSTAVRVLEALVCRQRALERTDALEREPPAPLVLPSLPRGSGPIAEDIAKRILTAAGLDVVDERVADTAAEALTAAAETGYPVVLKLVGTGLAHKTDVGAVRVALTSSAAVAEAAGELLALASSLGAEDSRLLIQPMIEDGVETIVGARRDPRLGPLVVFGMGGIFVETIRDVSVRGAPLTAQDARAMIGEVRGARVLEGVRGRSAVDIGALVQALLAMSRFILAAPPTVVEAEVNPLVVRPEGLGAVAVDALIVLEKEEGN
ncbi:MAG: acetate--CoA ligase family protein [Gaiellaceae bacterium MAG52_C11]|nr:acetate--CoA ligase family protein [Candidatus Gaiellasilicea maunaloa]